MHIKKSVSFLMALSFAASPVFVFADTAVTATTSTNAQVQAMLGQIQTLQAQIKAMQSLQAQIASTSSSISSTLGLIRNLRQGMSGDDVKALQAVLASDPTIYSGPISGFFGSLTADAVKKFQKKNGIEAVGYIGPKTLKKLNAEFEKHGISFQVSSSSAGIAVGEPNGQGAGCINIAPGHLIAPGFLKKEVENKGKGEWKDHNNDRNVMFIMSTTTTSPQATILPLCKPLPHGIEKKNGDDWKKPTTTPPVVVTSDTVAPVISGLAITGITASAANITWNTNENANGKIWFGTSSPLVLSGEGTTVGQVGTTHTANMSALSTSTTYYFVVGSRDAAGNLATSSQSSFTTLAQ